MGGGMGGYKFLLRNGWKGVRQGGGSKFCQKVRYVTVERSLIVKLN